MTTGPTQAAVTQAAQAADARQETEEQRTRRMWGEARRRIKIGPNGLIFENYDDLFLWATLNQDSAFVPKDFRGKPAEIAIAVEFGQTVGLSAVQSLQDVMVVHGRPSMYGNALLAVVRRSGRFNEEAYDLGFEGTPYDDDFMGWCTMARMGSAKPKRFEFSVADAKLGKLWMCKDRPAWCNHPKDMLLRRCHGRAMKYLFSDVLKGLYDRDEMLDVDAVLDNLDLTKLFMPKPKEGQTADEALTEQLSKPQTGTLAAEHTQVFRPTAPAAATVMAPAEEPSKPEPPPPTDKNYVPDFIKEPGHRAAPAPAEATPPPATELDPNKPIGSRSDLYKLLRFDFDGLSPVQKQVFRKALGIGLITDLAKWLPEPAAKAHERLRGMLVERGEETTE